MRSLTLRNFGAEEVAELYGQHTADTGQVFAPEATRLAFDLSRGQPWLVNALAYQVTFEDLRGRRRPVEAAHVERAKEILIARRDTHLDSLVDRLREPQVRRVIEPILAGDLVLGERIDDDVAYVEDLGLVERRNGHLEIANPIYREVIPRALAAVIQATIPHEPGWYVDADGRLDMAALLAGFAGFWIEHGEALLAHQPYPEVAPHLVLMAFLQRIVNSGGTIDREYAVGRGRMDLLVRWPHAGGVQREAIEIKVWRDRKADPLPRGLEQLAGYLERLGLERGALVLFDRRGNAPPPQERHEKQRLESAGREILVWRL